VDLEGAHGRGENTGVSEPVDRAAGFPTERLLVRELANDELEEVLAVYTSNPGYLELTEGSGGEPGRYDLGMLARDLALARATLVRHLAALRLRENGELVGVLDWLEEHPSDGMPWVGLVMIRAELQRQGLASEAFAALAELLRARGARTVRAGVLARNEPGRALAHRLGFETVSTTVQRMASEETVLVVERSLE
jgi:RimJ/RimL family protein N-acetyltransferase